MATINAPSVNNNPPTPCDGGPAVHYGKVTLAAAQVADIVRLCVLPAGSKVFAFKTVNAALGASSTLAIGFAPVDGTNPTADADKFSNDTTISTAAAARTEFNGAPISFDYDVYVTATVGGAAATGAVDVVVEYENVGLK